MKKIVLFLMIFALVSCNKDNLEDSVPKEPTVQLITNKGIHRIDIILPKYITGENPKVAQFRSISYDDWQVYEKKYNYDSWYPIDKIWHAYTHNSFTKDSIGAYSCTEFSGGKFRSGNDCFYFQLTLNRCPAGDIKIKGYIDNRIVTDTVVTVKSHYVGPEFPYHIDPTKIIYSTTNGLQIIKLKE